MRRQHGRPPSGNGASSLHLRWVWAGPAPDLVEVSAVLTVLEPTPSDDLRFWALQVGFDASGRRFGAGHVGLQRHPGHPGATAVNWGGYAAGGGELAGSTSTLPSARGNPNTRDLRWDVGVAYRVAVRRSADRTAWGGWVDDVHVRDLHAGGDRLVGAMVWSEVFAPCEERHGVRWSDLEGVTVDGDVVRPVAVDVNYQAWGDGGCTNTDSSLDADVRGAVVQRTGTRRRTPQGARLPLVEPISPRRAR